MSQQNVSVPRSLLPLLALGLAVSLVAVAFLLGRESMRSSTTAPPESSPAAPLAAVESSPSAPLSAAPPPPAPASTPAGGVSATPAAPRVVIASRTPPQTPAQPAPAVDSAARAGVAAYFNEMDNIQPGAMSDDPQSMATDILQGAMSGDTSALDDLISKAEAADRRARALHPPPPCSAWHQRALALSTDSLRLIRSLRRALSSGDTNALMNASARAGQMQPQAEALKRDEEAIKRRYGI